MIRVEWVRQTRRLRTWTCIAALAALPVVFSVSLYVDPPRRFRDVNVFTLATRSGLNVAVAALVFMSQFFLVVVVAAFAGETVSGEATWGTLRYLLVRPVSRARLILSKILVAYVLTLFAILAIVGAGLIAGTITFGWHDALVIERRLSFPLPVTIPVSEAIGRLALGSGYVALTMLFVVVLGVFLSTLTDSTAGAVVGTIVVIVASGVLASLPGLEQIKPVLPTRYWDQWTHLYTGDTATDMWKGAASAIAWSIVVTLVAVWRFQRKDILS